MIQTTNHRIVQILLKEGANYNCNGDFYNSANILSTELNITLKEAYEILLECDMYKKDDYAIKSEIKKLSDTEVFNYDTHCEDCGKEYVDNPNAEDIWENYKCTYCGYPKG